MNVTVIVSSLILNRYCPLETISENFFGKPLKSQQSYRSTTKFKAKPTAKTLEQPLWKLL